MDASSFSWQQEAVKCLMQLAEKLRNGHEARQLRLSPHLVLQSQSVLDLESWNHGPMVGEHDLELGNLWVTFLSDYEIL